MPHKPELYWQRTFKVAFVTGVLIFIAAMFGLLVVLFLPRPSWAAWVNVAQEWEPYKLTPEQRLWFKKVRSPHGVPCCDWSDGHPTEADARSDNHYWVPINGAWHQVPTEAVIYDVGNPIGEPVVWYIRQGPDAVFIRCFVPGGGV
jgi:hypothetical protein